MKATVFFCDIMGTIDGKRENSLTDYENFNKLILEIKKQNNSDVVIFSLISSDNPEVVDQKSKFLSNYFDESIALKKQFFDRGYIDENDLVVGPSGKCQQIVGYLNELSEKYTFDDVIFADDLGQIHEMLNIISSYHSWSDKITSIIPTKGLGLVELNSLLEQYLSKKQVIK